MTVIADTGATVALLDADDRHHKALLEIYRKSPTRWLLPWVTLAEVDYLTTKYLGDRCATAFHRDVAEGIFHVERGQDADLIRALAIRKRYADLAIGLVDSVVMAISERINAAAIATLDYRHFAQVQLRGQPKLYPRDC